MMVVVVMAPPVMVMMMVVVVVKKLHLLDRCLFFCNRPFLDRRLCLQQRKSIRNRLQKVRIGTRLQRSLHRKRRGGRSLSRSRCHQRTDRTDNTR